MARRRFIVAIVLCLAGPLFLPGSSAARPPPAGERQTPRDRYVLEATLHPDDHAVEGHERIRWTNHASEPVDRLELHLYLNAFESDDTVFMRESGGRLRGVAARGRGHIDVTEFRIRDGPDLLARARTDLVEGDATQMRVPLPQEVAPGETLELVLRFRAKLPPLFARSGYVDDFHLVAQWFPKLARLEPDGEWVNFPYHGHGEFYADFARYELSVRVPEGWVVGATGKRVSKQREGAYVVHRFAAEPVHDAAFVAWPHFEQRRARAEDVEIRVLHPPGYEAAVDHHVKVTRRGLRTFGRLYGSYPYSTLTVIVPPRGAEGGAGMEYPALFVTGGPWLPVPGVRMGLQQELTAHELAHQWFQGLVATNEVRWPMLDEGLTQWASWDLLGRMYGRRRSAVSTPWIELDGFELQRLLSLRAGSPPPPPGRPAYEFGPLEYGRSVYARPAVTLETIARVWGRRHLERALGRYARRHRFGHPTPEDLFRAFDEVYWRGFSADVLEPALMEGKRADAALTRLRSARQDGQWHTTLVAERTGALPIPAWVRLHHADGDTERIRWPADSSRLEHHHRGERVVGARLDPHRHLMLEGSVLDDVRAPPDAPAADHGLLGAFLLAAQSWLTGLGP